MAPEQVSEDELRRICLDAASRGERVGHILNDYLYLSFLHEQQEADRAAGHRSDEEPQDRRPHLSAPSRDGRHRADGMPEMSQPLRATAR